MRIVRASEFRRMPWKNGGGETYEIAVFPPEASLDDFDWRVSMARVASDGSFSTFEGVDRTLTILEGAGLYLDIEGFKTIELTPRTAPYRFSAELSASARLVSGTILDLNVMTRIGHFDHTVDFLELKEKIEIECDQSIFILFSDKKININYNTVIDKNSAVIMTFGEKITLHSIESVRLALIKINNYNN